MNVRTGRIDAVPVVAAEESGTHSEAVDGSSAADPTAPPRGYTVEPLPAEALRLDGAAESLDDLLEVVQLGLAERDSLRLAELMVNEREYRDILYPAWPAAYPPINARFETLWVLHYPDAVRGLGRLLREYGGRDVEIVGVDFARPDQDFVNFTLHQGSCVDVVVDGVRIDGARLLGSVYRVGDQWKLLSYPEDPTPAPVPAP